MSVRRSVMAQRSHLGDVQHPALLEDPDTHGVPGLAIWLLVAGTGAILLLHAVTTPGAGLAALAGLGGLTVCILYIGLDAPNWAGWTQLALTLLGVLGAALIAARVCDDRFTSGSGAEELQATVAGVLFPVRRPGVHRGAHRDTRHQSGGLTRRRASIRNWSGGATGQATNRRASSLRRVFRQPLGEDDPCRQPR